MQPASPRRLSPPPRPMQPAPPHQLPSPAPTRRWPTRSATRARRRPTECPRPARASTPPRWRLSSGWRDAGRRVAALTSMTDQVTITTPAWSGNPADLVDLDRYPLLDPDGAALGGVVAAAREQMGGLGLAELGGFVRADALELLLADAESLAPLAWRSGGLGPAYLAAPDAELPEAHPRGWAGPYSVGAVGYDLFPPG